MLDRSNLLEGKFMIAKNKLFFSFVFISLFVSFSLFSSGTKEGALTSTSKEERIVVYASGPAQMLQALEKEFEKERGDVIDIVQMGCGPLRQRVWTEMESGEIKADVFWGSDPLLYNALDDRGALEPLSLSQKEMLAERFITNRNYILVNERYGVIIYNGDKLKGVKVPTSYLDLLSPMYKGTITHADPAQSSTALAIVAALWDIFDQDWDYQTKLVQNGLFLTKKNSDVPSKIQEGEFDVGIAPHDAVLRLQKKAKKEGFPTPLKISWPEKGVIAIPRPVGISKNENRSPLKAKLAHDFVDFLISKEAQQITSSFGFVSIRKDVSLAQGVVSNLDLKILDWEDLSLKQDYIKNEFKKITN